jgi:hypothetical protein
MLENGNSQYRKWFPQALLSLNLGFAVSYGVVGYNFLQVGTSKNSSSGQQFLYYFFRAAVRVNNLLHLSSSNPGFGRLPNPGSSIGVDLVFLISTIAIAALLFTFIHLFLLLLHSSFIVAAVTTSLIMLALPGAYLFRSRSFTPQNNNHLIPMAVGELLVFAALLLPRKKVIFSWAIGLLMLFHYCFWLSVLWRNSDGLGPYRIYSIQCLLLIYAASGAVLLIYLSDQSGSGDTKERCGNSAACLLGLPALGLCTLSAMWLSPKKYDLVHAKSPQSLVIEMRRDGYGIGPVYKVTIQGNGKVQYLGERHVRERGVEETSIAQDEIRQLEADFDRADFFALEDRAFAWCFHSSRVTVRITIDGKSKEASSDDYCVGAKSGLQARFVEAAIAVDKTLGTERWTRCGDRGCSD